VFAVALLAALRPAQAADGPLKVPAAFSKSLPGSLADVREMETHVVRLIDRVKPATVGLRVGRAYGSGVIVTEEGIILTAGHVTGGPGRRVDVMLSDGTRVQGTTLGRNRALDSGMIRLPSDRKWPHADLAPAGSVSAGNWCLGLGHPGGYDEARGVVVRMGRVIAARRRFLQTDCKIVGGDSGGPLFDMSGRVIGIHSRIGESADFNFHVPAAVFKDEWDRLASSEDFAGHSGALLGVSGTKNPNGRGLVLKAHRGEPAQHAGVQDGDVLILFESKEIKSLEQLIDLVGQQLPGKIVTLEVLRNGKVLRFRVELGMRWD
jgi:serine protease Do